LLIVHDYFASFEKDASLQVDHGIIQFVALQNCYLLKTPIDKAVFFLEIVQSIIGATAKTGPLE